MKFASALPLIAAFGSYLTPSVVGVEVDLAATFSNVGTETFTEQEIADEIASEIDGARRRALGEAHAHRELTAYTVVPNTASFTVFPEADPPVDQARQDRCLLSPFSGPDGIIQFRIDRGLFLPAPPLKCWTETLIFRVNIDETDPDFSVTFPTGIFALEALLEERITAYLQDRDPLGNAFVYEEQDFITGDPHLKTWGGKEYDYMGECDLVFLDAPKFSDDMAMHIDVRTKIRYEYSFVESAVIKIGEETFEVGSWGEYFLNGVEGAVLPASISGYTITKTMESEKQHKFEIQISEDEIIEFKTFKDWVSVVIHKPNHKRYVGATGMMGNHEVKGLIGRDGVTEFSDVDAFGQEWQVRADEPMLFQTARLPQAPQQCFLPSTKKTQRRLGESIALEAAEKACQKAGWSKGTIQMCIHDVMATGDLEMAEAGVM